MIRAGMNVTLNIKKLMLEQVDAEIAGKSEFQCPVCSGKAVWSRDNSGKRLSCRCHGCGMYFECVNGSEE